METENKRILTNEIGNDLISQWIKEDKTFAVSRVGNAELAAVYSYELNKNIPNGVKRWLSVNVGVYGGDTVYPYFVEEYSKGISAGDLQVWWNHIPKVQQEVVFDKYSNGLEVENRCIEPFYFDNPWSKELEGKKVLVITPFADTIKEQYENKRELLFENKDILPQFELITYKSVQSINEQGPHSSWKESLDVMKKDISQIDFDIALLGCGGYGLPLLSYIKTNLNKSSIYMGGGVQIMFGVKGKRWETHNVINKFFNEHWTIPSKKEMPLNYKMVENGCYWG